MHQQNPNLTPSAWDYILHPVDDFNSGLFNLHGGKMNLSIKFFSGLMIFASLLFAARVEYTCKPYSPSDECETGLYRMELFAYDWERYPKGRVEAHCIVIQNGRIVAQTGFLDVFESKSRDVIDRMYFEEQQFPTGYAEICKVM